MIATPPKYPVLTDSSARTGLVSVERAMAAKTVRPQSLAACLKCPCSIARIVRLQLFADLITLPIPFFATKNFHRWARHSMAFVEPDEVSVTFPERSGYRQVTVNFGVVH